MTIEIIESPFSAHDNMLYKFLHMYLVDENIYDENSYPHTTKKIYRLKISNIDVPIWILHNEQEYIKYEGSEDEYTFYFYPIKGENRIKVVSTDKQQLYCSIDINTNNKDIFTGLTAQEIKNLWDRLYQIQANTYYADNLIKDTSGNDLTPQWKFTKAIGTLLGVERYSGFTDAQYYNFLHNVFDMNLYGGTDTAIYLLKQALTDWIDKIDVIPFEEYFPHTDVYNKLFLTKNGLPYSLYSVGGKILRADTNIRLSDSQKFSLNFWISTNSDVPILNVYNSSDILSCEIDSGNVSVSLNGNSIASTTYNGSYSLITVVKNADELKMYVNGVLDNTASYVDSITVPEEDCNLLLGSNAVGNEFFAGYLGEFQFLDNYALSDTEIADFYEFGIPDDYNNVFTNGISRIHYKWINGDIEMNFGEDNIIVTLNTFSDSDLDVTNIYPIRRNINDGTDNNLLIYPTYMFYDRRWRKIDYYNEPNTLQNKYIYVDGEENIYDSLVIKDSTDVNIYKEEYYFTQRFDSTDFLKDTTNGLYTGFPESLFVILDRPNIDTTAVITDSPSNNINVSMGAYYDSESEYNIVNLMMLENDQSNVDYIDVQYKTYRNNKVLGYCIYDATTYTINKSGHLNVDDINLGNKDNQYGSIVIVIRCSVNIDDELKTLIEYLIGNIIPAHIKWYIYYDFDAWRNWGQTDLTFGDFADAMSIFYNSKYKDFL